MEFSYICVTWISFTPDFLFLPSVATKKIQKIGCKNMQDLNGGPFTPIKTPLNPVKITVSLHTIVETDK